MASFPATLLDDSDDRAARLVALALLADASAQRERLGRDADRDALHDFRVAVRRVRSWLRAQKGVLDDSVPRRAVKWLRRLARATNTSRDSEVFADWVNSVRPTLAGRHRAGVTWLLTRLTRARRDADVAVLDEVDRDFERARDLLDERLPVYRVVYHVHDGVRAASFAGGMASLVKAHGTSLRRRLNGVRGIADQAAVHRARIAGKRLRYLLEPIAEHVGRGKDVIAALKRMQDAFGDLHDAHVWLARLREELELAGNEEARELASAARLENPEPKAKKQPVHRDPRPGLLALAELLRARAVETWEIIERECLGDGSASLFGDLDAIVAELEARGRSGVEVERKYLLSGLPSELPEVEVREIDQGYLPGHALVERIRRVRVNGDERYYRTVKVGRGVSRTELEDETTRAVFDAMWPLSRGKRIAKRRHVVQDGALAWEIDEFIDRSLVLAEIELPSPELVPDIPEWLSPHLVREVTDEPEFVNANLAR